MATIAGARSNRAVSALVFLLGTAVFLNYVDRGAIGIAAPLMKSELGLSEEAYGLAFSAFFWIYAPCSSSPAGCATASPSTSSWPSASCCGREAHC